MMAHSGVTSRIDRIYFGHLCARNSAARCRIDGQYYIPGKGVRSTSEQITSSRQLKICLDKLRGDNPKAALTRSGKMKQK